MTTTQPWSSWVTVLMDLMADILRFSLWGLVVVVAISVLCGIEVNEHLANGDPHGSHPRAFFFSCNVASHRRLVAEQVTSDEHCYICAVWSCDEHHTTMIFEGRARPRRLVVMIIVVFGLCGLVTHVFHHGIWRTLTLKSRLSWRQLFCVRWT